MRARSVALYALLLAVAIGGFLLIRAAGSRVVAPSAAPGVALFGSGDAHAGPQTLPHVLLALIVVVILARLVGAAFRFVHQPPVMGEVVAGILLGPSLLGRVAPDVAAYLLPRTVAPYLGNLAQVGVILYMFLVGLELDTGTLKHRTHASVAISHASIVAPFVLGSTLALVLYPRLATRDVPFTVFALFLGASMSVTAFPVLARILTDRRMHRSPLGITALTCAAVDDVTAWCLLAFVVAVAQARPDHALVTGALALAYIAAMFVLVRPVVQRLARRLDTRSEISQGVIAIVLVALLLSSLLTELIGIHALFGAFLLGAVVPHDSLLARSLVQKLEDFVIVLLLPAFFAFTGMRTQIGLVHGATAWGLCGLIIVVASAGKFGGSALAARATGLPWSESAALGVLMNTRGLMELIVLNLGLDLHVLSPTLFAMLVVMALVTTFATTPALHLLTRKRVGLDLQGSGAAPST